jgi:tetratricopeptide (TPR) repeat protein
MKRNEKAAEPEIISPGGEQLKIWGQAVRLFGEQRFEEARQCFLQAAAGPDSQVADKARSYFQICERKTAKGEPECTTADEHFTYGVERLNSRDLAKAHLHLEKARTLEPAGDHILYTLALCHGLSGDGNGAYENLKLAISLEPGNRIRARQDPEFAGLMRQLPSLRTLLD